MSKTKIDPLFGELGLDAEGKPVTDTSPEVTHSPDCPPDSGEAANTETAFPDSAPANGIAADTDNKESARDCRVTDVSSSEEHPEHPMESSEWQLFIDSLSGEAEISDSLRRPMKIDADILATVKLCKPKKTAMKAMVNAMLRAFILSHKEDFIRLRSIHNPGAAPIF